MKRLLPIALLVAVMLAGAASAAGASAAQLPTTPFALPRWQSPAMPPALAQTGSVPQPTAELRFAPVTVSVNDVDYTMRMDVFAFVTQVGSFTFFDVSLSRGAVGSAVQSHLYWLAPANPISFHVARRTLATATFDSGAELAPDAFAGSFTASASQKRVACTLTNGRTGYRSSAPGTVSWSQFSLDTGTSPFFGTLVNGPADAKLIWDPGCKQRRHHHRRHLPACGFRDILSAQDAAGSNAFEIGLNYPRTRTLQAVVNAFDPTDVKAVIHFSVAAGPAGDLPPPTHSATGATAHVVTTGSPFLTGSSTFTSSHAPRVSLVHRCRAQGSVHHYRSLRYRGGLAPDPTPLTAPFDTGDLAVPAMPAVLVVRRYLD
jgi:hypothetical protein